MADYEALDISEIELESTRVNSKEPQNENSGVYVRYPETNSFTVIRFLPKRKGEPLFCAAKYHFLKDANGNRKVFFSPKQLIRTDKGPRWVGDNSIIDKYLRDLWAKSEKVSGQAQIDLRNQYRELKGIERYYYNVIVRQEKDPKTGETLKNVGPKIFSCGKTIHGMIMRAIVGDQAAGEDALGDVTNLKTGRDFKLVKKSVKGAGGEYPNYDQSKFLDPSPLGEPKEAETWLSNLHDLQAIRIVKSEDELKQALKIHLGLVRDAADDDFNADEFSPQSRSSSAKEVDLGLESAPSSTSVVEEEVMADDEFLKEIDDL